MLKRIQQPRTYASSRLKVIWGILLVFYIIVILRLFYLQILRHDQFLEQANASQIKSLEIEAQRGAIYAWNNGRKVPLVVNERRWTLFADAKFVEDRTGLIRNLESLGVILTPSQKEELASDSRYIVLKKRITDKGRKRIIEGLKYRGVYFQEQDIRRYIEGVWLVRCSVS